MNHMLHMLYSSLLFSFEFYLTFFLGGGGRQTLARLTENKKYPFFLHCVKKQQALRWMSDFGH